MKPRSHEEIEDLEEGWYVFACFKQLRVLRGLIIFSLPKQAQKCY